MTVATPNQDYLAFEAAMKARDPRWYESSPACIGYMAWCASRDSAAQQEPLCMCKDRALGACPGEWEPGCDLGNNPAHVRPAGITATKGER